MSFIAHIKVPYTVDGNPVVIAVKYGSPCEVLTFVKMNYELKTLTYPFELAKEIVSCVRCSDSGVWVTSLDGSVIWIQNREY